MKIYIHHEMDQNLCAIFTTLKAAKQHGDEVTGRPFEGDECKWYYNRNHKCYRRDEYETIFVRDTPG